MTKMVDLCMKSKALGSGITETIQPLHFKQYDFGLQSPISNYGEIYESQV
jgi:hypothetical protein